MKKRIVKTIFAIVFIVILPLSVYAHVVCQPGMCDWQRTSNLRVSVEYKDDKQHKVTEREREKCSICGDIRTTRTIFTYENHQMHIVKNPPYCYVKKNQYKHIAKSYTYNKCKYCSYGKKIDDTIVEENHTRVPVYKRDPKNKNSQIITYYKCSVCGEILK